MDAGLTANLVEKSNRKNLLVFTLTVRATLLFLFFTVSSPTRVTTALTETWKYGEQPSSGLCGDGKQQSPVSIVRADVFTDTKASITLRNYDTFVPTNATVSFDHDTVTVFADASSPVYLILDEDKKDATTFILHSLVFHWADTEHHFRDVSDFSLRLEAHLVHYNREFDSAEEAMNRENGLGVLAILFQLKRDEQNSSPLDNVISIASGKGGSVRWADLVPAASTNLSVYQYNGSMTRLPCQETVIWHVLPPPHFGSLNLSQLEWFRKSHNPPIETNCRSSQPLNNRQIRQVRLEWAGGLTVNENELTSTLSSPMFNSTSETPTEQPTFSAYLFSFIPLAMMVALLGMFWYFYRESTREHRL